MADLSKEKESVYENTNGFPMAGGKNLHMETGKGDLANRIVTVGAVSRLEKIVEHMDKDSITFRNASGRGFTCVTGKYQGTPVSVVAIGMGISMMDFFVRESRAVIDGPMAVIRFGTCGGLSMLAPVGSVVVASKGSALIHRNHDAFVNNYTEAATDSKVTLEEGYSLSKLAPSSPELSALLVQYLSDIERASVVEGVNVSADSFYSSQGRLDDNFDDCNVNLIADYVLSRYPNAGSMEMESYSLLHLARCSRTPIHAAAASIVVANRCSSDVIPGELLEHMESSGAKAVLQALVGYQL